jgi:hypothetical protein
MMPKTPLLSGVLLLVSGIGCGEVERPELCAFRAADFADPASVTLDACRGVPLRVHDADIVYVLHTLPDEVDIDDKLTVTISTPFEKQTSEHEHADHKVLFAFAAPEGAACSLEITATIANEQARLISLPVDDASCAGSAGAGAGGATASEEPASD